MIEAHFESFYFAGPYKRYSAYSLDCAIRIRPQTNIALVFVRDFDPPAAGLVPSHTAIPRIQVGSVHSSGMKEIKVLIMIIKIGDFGATKKEEEIWITATTPLLSAEGRIRERIAKWNQRHAGKLGYSLPVMHSRFPIFRLQMLIARRTLRNNSERIGT